MASSKFLTQQLYDLTKCPICMDTFKEPRMLPCMHNFCLQCLLLDSKGKPSGSVFPCPLCRDISTIPQGGFGSLPLSFFVEDTVQLYKVSEAVSPEGGHKDSASSLYEILSKSGISSALKMSTKGNINSQNGYQVTQATGYFVDWLWDKRTDVYRMMKLTANHNLLPVEVNSNPEYTKRQSSFYIIQEVYENGNSAEYFESQLDDALDRAIQTIIIEPTRLGTETSRWLTIGNFLHRAALLSGVVYITAQHLWPNLAEFFNWPRPTWVVRFSVPFGAASIVCSAVYTVSWQLDNCSRYRVEKDAKRLRALPLEASAAPVVLVRQTYPKQLVRTLTSLSVTVYCGWRVYRWYTS